MTDRERTANWRRRNPVAWKASLKKYRQSSKFKSAHAAANAKRRQRKQTALVPMAKKELIRLWYQNCPFGYVVDHIIPLNGEKVSGLHLETNLQYLTFSENSRKQHHFDENEYKSWCATIAVQGLINPFLG